MTEWRVEVVRIKNVQKHPNADTLSIADANGFPVIFKTGDFESGQLAVHVPVDSIVPAGDPRWEFLGGHNRIRAKKLRGVFSMGLLTPAEPTWGLGDLVAHQLGIVKHDPDAAREAGSGPGARGAKSVQVATRFGGLLRYPGDNEKDPGLCPKYDIEGLRRYPNLIGDGEEVWISEKVHGQNARFVHDGKRLWVASRNHFKRERPEYTFWNFVREKIRGNLAHISWYTFIACWFGGFSLPSTTWWAVARRYDLTNKLKNIQHIAIYGETYGNNSDLHYGVRSVDNHETDRFVAFDAYDCREQRWLDVDVFLSVMKQLGIPVVPTLYRGPWNPTIAWSLAEMDSELHRQNQPPGSVMGPHLAEGVVVKPVIGRVDPTFGRVFLKAVSQRYLLRSSA